MIASQVEPSGDLFAALKLLCMAAFAWHALTILGRRSGTRASMVALAGATGLAWAAVAAMVIYKVVALLPFDWAAVAMALDDARRTLVAVLGPNGVAIVLAALAGLALAASAAAWLLFRVLRAAIERIAPGARTAVLCLGLLSYLAAADLWYAAGELVLHSRWSYGEQPFNAPVPRVPDYSALAIRSDESVFILQLESVNAHAVYERSEDGQGYRARIPQPGVEAILRDGGGVLFPLFWANGPQTNRAWESILCGVSGNVGAPFSGDPLRLGRKVCLPAKLAAAGYATVFLYSYFDLEFFNLGGFARRAGFQEVAFGSKLMAEGDRRHAWAYDDCVFYRRAFEHLAARKLDSRERVLAYFEVGMNHAPFRDTMKYPQAHPYREPASLLEHYLNSVAEQDYCLGQFWERFRALGRDDIHLFILPDHGLWLPGFARQPDPTFATWLAYVPPARRRAEFKPRAVFAPVPSQAQLYPTILELLGSSAVATSFAFALRGQQAGTGGYEDCQVLGQPAGSLIVHRNGERAQYNARTGEVTEPTGARSTADYRLFWERFGCRSE